MKKKKFTVHYHVDSVYEGTIPAESIEEALQKAKGMSKTELDATLGDIIYESVRITAVFE